MQPETLVSGLGYLGPPIDHRENLELLLRGQGFDLVSIPDSVNRAKPREASGAGNVVQRLERLWAQFQGTTDQAYLSDALRRIDEGGVRCVLAYWGTRPLVDIKALKRRRPDVKFILNVLCHPVGLAALTVKMQNLVLGGAVDSLDGLIVSSSVMQNYLWDKIPGTRKVPSQILPPYWCARYGPTIDLPPTQREPNILFLGRMDWKSGQPSDNVTENLRELLREGIDVHFSRSPESEIDEPHARPFDPVPWGQLANFAAPFDASLIVYNLARVSAADRFENTVPDRVITSLAARLPIALPSRGFSACREYLSDYGAVIEYDSMAHLAEQLRDRPHIDALRKIARERGARFNAEATFEDLRRFIVRVQPALG